MIKLKTTNRGFLRGEFKDLFGSDCSIQESSLAIQPALWLGVDKGFDEKERRPGGRRMHLDQATARQLIEYLQRFVNTGGLAT
jgi:hypothetical protein